MTAVAMAGSAHTLLAPYWAEQLVKTELTGELPLQCLMYSVVYTSMQSSGCNICQLLLVLVYVLDAANRAIYWYIIMLR